MSRTLTSREKNLLLLCLGVLAVMAAVLSASTFLQKRSLALKRVEELELQEAENQALLGDRAFWDKRRAWLDQSLPATDSLGRAQGQMLEQLQNEALDKQIKVLQQTLPEQTETDHYRETSVSVRLYGSQDVLLQWIATMQSPEKFQVVKHIEFEPDTRSKAVTPQAQCNLTLARWFKREGA